MCMWCNISQKRDIKHRMLYQDVTWIKKYSVIFCVCLSHIVLTQSSSLRLRLHRASEVQTAVVQWSTGWEVLCRHCVSLGCWSVSVWHSSCELCPFFTSADKLIFDPFGSRPPGCPDFCCSGATLSLSPPPSPSSSTAGSMVPWWRTWPRNWSFI